MGGWQREEGGETLPCARGRPKIFFQERFLRQQNNLLAILRLPNVGKLVFARVLLTLLLLIVQTYVTIIQVDHFVPKSCVDF